MTLSKRRRDDIITALRNGTVPGNGLDVLAVGLDHFAPAIAEDFTRVQGGSAHFRAVRGEYGSGKTFFSRWLGEQAKQRGMAVAEVQISITETPLHKLETVYRRVCENIQTSNEKPSAFKAILDSWLYALESSGEDVAELLERRLREVSKTTPAFATVLRRYNEAIEDNDQPLVEGLVAWLAGQPHVAAAHRRAAGVKGELDNGMAFGFLQGLLTVLRDSGHPGLLLVLDEVETIQRMRSDTRDKALNALRQLIDEMDKGRFPGLFLVITGTPAFFDGANGAARLAPLAQRLATHFGDNPEWDNIRGTQLRLSGFTEAKLIQLGTRVRDIYQQGATNPERIAAKVDDAFIADFARQAIGGLGGKVGIAPRLFLKKLIDICLDRVDLHERFDPRRDGGFTLHPSELTVEERNLAAGQPAGEDLDEIELT